MRLADSKIFRGDDETLDPKKDIRSERKITVYIPAAYIDGTKAPILVMHDGPSNLNLVRNALDNLTISKNDARRLPAFIAIAVQNEAMTVKAAQRGLEYDTMSDRLARFINDEVLPSVLSNQRSRQRIQSSPSPRTHGVAQLWVAVLVVLQRLPWAGSDLISSED